MVKCDDADILILVHAPRKLQHIMYCIKYYTYTPTVANLCYLSLTFSASQRVTLCKQLRQFKAGKRLTGLIATAFLSASLPSTDTRCLVAHLMHHHHQAGVHHDGLEPEMSASLDTRPLPTREVSGGEVGIPLGEVQKTTNRHSKRWVKEAFEHRPENADKQATCRYCHKIRSTLNPTRQKEHLLNKKECQYLQSEDARMSTDPEVQSILAGGSLHPTPRRPKSERESGSSGGRVVPTAGRGLRKEMNETALKFLTQANRPELWAVFSGWVTELPADRVESEYDRLVMLHQSAIQDPAMQAAMLQYFETVCAKVGIGSVA